MQQLAPCCHLRYPGVRPCERAGLFFFFRCVHDSSGRPRNDRLTTPAIITVPSSRLPSVLGETRDVFMSFPGLLFSV